MSQDPVGLSYILMAMEVAISLLVGLIAILVFTNALGSRRSVYARIESKKQQPYQRRR